MRIVTILVTALLAVVVVGAPAEAKPVKLSLTSGTVAVDAGQKVKLKGSATNATKGDRVTIQVKAPGSAKWAALGTAKVKKSLTFKATVRPTAPGRTMYRAKLGNRTSSTVAVTTYAWIDLATQSYYAVTSNVFINGTVRQGGVAYPHSFWTYAAAAWVYNLDPSCTTVRATYARSDDNATVKGEVHAEIILYGDGEPATTEGTVTAGPVPVSVPVLAGSRTLALSVGVSGEATAAILTPQIRCAVGALPTMHPGDLGF